MSIEIVVPSVGESIREATISRWFKNTGDAVKLDEPLLEIETDKITTEINAPQKGVLGAILRKTGETVKIGEVVALLETEAAPTKEAPTVAPSTSVAESSKPLSPSAREAVREKAIQLSYFW